MRTERPIRYQEISPRRRRSRSSPEQAAKRYSVRRVKAAPPLLTRSRLRIALALTAASVVLFGAALVYRSPLFSVRRVQLTGLAPLLPEEAAQVQAAAAIPSGTNLFRVSCGRLEAALKRVPWVAGARVTRRLPNEVDAAVVTRLPVALISTGGVPWEVDKSAVAIRPGRHSATLPMIDCLAAGTLTAGQRIDLPGVAGALKAAVLTSRGKPLGIAKIEVDQNADICLNMVDSVAIRIGQIDELDTKLDLVRRIYDERPDIAAEVETIDLRFPEAPAYLPRGTARKTRHAGQADETAGAGARDHVSESSPVRDSAGSPNGEMVAGEPAAAQERHRGQRRLPRRNHIERLANKQEGESDRTPGERR